MKFQAIFPMPLKTRRTHTRTNRKVCWNSNLTVPTSITLIGSLVSNVRFRKCQLRTFRTDSLVTVLAISHDVLNFTRREKKI